MTDVFEDDSSVNIVMEFFEGKTLYQWLKQNLKKEKAPPATKQKIISTVFYQMCEAIALAHAYGIVHRDIKLDNFMIHVDPITKEITTKIIDFGLSAVLYQGEKATLTVGSIAYLSPEILHKQPYDFKTDVWSLGISLYCMLTGKLPFVDDTVEQTISNIKRKEVNFDKPCWADVPASAKELVSLMLTKDPAKRPNVDAVLEHKWLKRRRT